MALIAWAVVNTSVVACEMTHLAASRAVDELV